MLASGPTLHRKPTGFLIHKYMLDGWSNEMHNLLAHTDIGSRVCACMLLPLMYVSLSNVTILSGILCGGDKQE